MIKEDKFKENFISTFLATWTANNYDNYCIQGKQEDLEHPPVEDAIFLAESAWKKYKEISNI
jgi:hypothetical protein